MRIRGKEKVPQMLADAAPLLHNPDVRMIANTAEYTHLFLEVGCGRGAFITELAKRMPDALLIGVEKYTPIIARSAALAMSMGLTNVRFLDLEMDMAYGLLPANAFSGIFLNFSDPWPRRRNAIKRLTHPRFLSLYATLLRKDGTLSMKTDNQDFFEFTIASLQTAGWTLLRRERNLRTPETVDGAFDPALIQTEYEMRFRAKGKPIYHLLAAPPANES